MSGPNEIPEPRQLRKWLSWVVTERWGGLVRSARRWCRGQDTAAFEDVIHAGILEVLAGKAELPDDHQGAWRALLVTIRNVARNRYRTESVRRTESLDQVRRSADQVRDGRERGWRICERLEREELLEAALRRLTADQREVVELRYLKEWTVAEVAEERACTRDAVRKLEAKALAKLAVELETRFGPA